MATTTYHVFAGDAEIATATKRAKAIDKANAHRDEHGVSVRVATTAGHEVFAKAARRKIKMSPRYTRTVDLPEGVTAPDGARVAYVRSKRGFAVLDMPDDDEARYAILDLATSEVLEGERFATTRDAGAFMTAPAKA